jgi:hypothetical protein
MALTQTVSRRSIRRFGAIEIAALFRGAAKWKGAGLQAARNGDGPPGLRYRSRGIMTADHDAYGPDTGQTPTQTRPPPTDGARPQQAVPACPRAGVQRGRRPRAISRSPGRGRAAAPPTRGLATEVVYVDDGSGDDTLAVAQALPAGRWTSRSCRCRATSARRRR